MAPVEEGGFKCGSAGSSTDHVLAQHKIIEKVILSDSISDNISDNNVKLLGETSLSSSFESDENSECESGEISESSDDNSEVTSGIGGDGFTKVESRNKKRKRKKREQQNIGIQEKISEIRQVTTSNGANSTQGSNDNNSKKQGVILYFPKDCTMSHEEKQEWITDAFTDGFAVRVMHGKTSPIILGMSTETVQQLTTNGFKGIVLHQPKVREKATKVIIKGVHPNSHIQWFSQKYLFLKGVTWHKWSRSKREVIAWCTGEIPNSLSTPFAVEPLKVEEYIPKPTLCGKCSRWNHKMTEYTRPPRCRYCAGEHFSTICFEKISSGNQVVPKCANCNGQHNASSIKCTYNPGRTLLASSYNTQENLETNPSCTPSQDSVTPLFRNSTPHHPTQI